MFLKLFSKARLPDDLELLQQYRQTGDMEYVGKLFERHTEMVYLVCLKYLKSEEESKDATMQVFEQLLTALQKHEVNNFKSWLHTLARNHCLMQLRGRKGKETVSLPPGEIMESAPPLHLTEVEQHELELQALENGLADIPPEQRISLELFYLQQKSYKEIATLTNYELNSVKSYIQNGKRNLKLYLEKHHEQR